jgi:UV DNA damage endonuclease
MNKPLITTLEKAWAHHKYAVLEKDPEIYQRIRTLLKNKTDPDEALFFSLIEKAYAQEDQLGRQNNALLHVWGYFKHRATPEEKAMFEDKHSRWLILEVSIDEVRKTLFELALKYKVDYLLDSNYFDSIR